MRGACAYVANMLLSLGSVPWISVHNIILIGTFLLPCCSHFFIIDIHQDKPQPMMVSDPKGKLCHVSMVIADDLGYSMNKLVGAGPEGVSTTVWDLILPEPFCHVHSDHMGVGLLHGF